MLEKKSILIGFLMVCVLAGTASAAPAAASDWTMFHENLQHTGFVAQPADFSPNTWIFNAKSAIQSSPAILDKIIYFGSLDGTVHAVYLVNGTSNWTYKTGGKVLSSPAVANSTLYIGSMDGYL